MYFINLILPMLQCKSNCDCGNGMYCGTEGYTTGMCQVNSLLSPIRLKKCSCGWVWCFQVDFH